MGDKNGTGYFFVSITAQVLLTSHLMDRQCHFTPIIATIVPVMIGTLVAPLKLGVGRGATHF